MRLPGIDGNTVIERAHEIRPTMKCLIFTGSINYTMPPKLEAIGLGKEHLYLKPLEDLGTLAGGVRDLVGVDHEPGKQRTMTTAPTTLLTIEDDARTRRTIRACFQDAGYQVLEAENGCDGLEVFRARHPDIVLTDLLMPEVTGMEVVETLAREAPETPVVVVSGTGVLSDAIGAVRGGAWDYVTKPIEDLGVLEHVVVKALERAELLRHRRLYEEHLEQTVSERTADLCRRSQQLEETNRALRESEERQRTILDSIETGIVVIDPQQLQVVDVNPAAARMIGLPQENIVGCRCSQFFCDGNGEPCQLHESVPSRAATEQSLQTEHRGQIAIIKTVVPVVLDGRQHLLESFADITETKRAQDKIRRLNEELEEKVAQRTSALEALVAEFESFAYCVSHDLRAPLRSIDGFTQILLDTCSDQLDDTGKDCLHRVHVASQRMALLIDDILKLSRLARSEMTYQDVDLSALAHDITQECRKRDPDRQVEFVVASGISARGDPTLLRTVLENLLGNAWKFTSGHERARIEFGRTEVEGQPICFVRDDGAGFDMDYGSKLFGPFQRLHTTDEFPGTGIGLASVKRIINRHAGRVWGTGEVDKGACFYFYLPGQPQSSRFAA